MLNYHIEHLFSLYLKILQYQLNKHHFQKDDNVKLFSFSNMWSELSQHETINLTATDIQRIINEQVSFAFTLYSYLFERIFAL